MTCKERILSNDYADVVTDFLLPLETWTSAMELECAAILEGGFIIRYIERSTIPQLSVAQYAYHLIPKCYGLMIDGGTGRTLEPFDPVSLIHSGIRQTQLPPLELTGRGVILAFADTGIDYQNEVFCFSDGSSRILSIWDQTIQEGNTPDGFLFGSEYTREDINQALQSENPLAVVPTRDENGHGTAVISVAAGSELRSGVDFLGAAPDADILVVKLKEAKQYLREYHFIPPGVPAYAESDIMLAIQYMDRFAVAFNRPIVFCIAMGSNMGARTGDSNLSRYLNIIGRKRSRAVVVCGGNEGNAAHHFEGNVCAGGQGIPSAEDVEIRVTENNRGFVTEFWGHLPDTYSLSIRSPGGEQVSGVGTRSGRNIEYRFLYENTRIVMDYLLVEESSGDELIVIRFENPTPGIWTIRVEGELGCTGTSYDLWLPIEDFLYSSTTFLRPTPYTTLTMPSYAQEVMTTSTYNDANNSFYINSGRGFGRSVEITPDFAAPGVNVSTVLGRRTGSGIAAALAAGAVAQFMQWSVVEENETYVYSRDIRNYFIRGALREPGIQYPSREWGFGRLNIEGVFASIVR